jgi:hypothetical protein
MALPKVKYPTFITTIPSSGKSVKFRPFTVAEEKILITALEGNEQKEIITSLETCIEACFQEIDISSLTSYDVEFLFVQIRAKSISPIIEMEFRNNRCPENEFEPCKKVVLMKINVDDAKIQKVNSDGIYEDYKPSSKEKNITLDDDLFVTMKHPSSLQINQAISSNNINEQTHELVKSCIVSVADKETVYSDFTKEEMNDWYDTLISDQKDKLIKFIDEIPVLRYTSNFVCSKCNYTEEIELEGLSSFFV